MANIVKKFEIETLKDRKVNMTSYKRVPVEGEPGKFHLQVSKEVITYPESFMVYFPGGHSVWFASKADMQRAGILESENADIDADTGLPVEPPKVRSLKELVERKTTDRRMQGAV